MLQKLNAVVGEFGYPRVIRPFINAAPVDLELDISGEVSRGVRFNGNISTGSDSKIERNVTCHGDISIKENANLGKGSELRGDISVGRYTNLVRNNWVLGEVSLGNFCAIAPHVAFQGTNHDLSHWAIQQRWQQEVFGESQPSVVEPITVGSDVWIGRNAIILPGVDIGHGACIGAGAVVTRDIDPFSIVAGVPAENIDWRFDVKTREKLLELAWWEWEVSEIKSRTDEIQGLVS